MMIISAIIIYIMRYLYQNISLVLDHIHAYTYTVYPHLPFLVIRLRCKAAQPMYVYDTIQYTYIQGYISLYS